MQKHGLFEAKCIAAISLWLAVIVLCLGQVPVVAAGNTQVKELNFVYLHGRGSTSADLQLLADTLEERAQPYLSAFAQANPGTIIKINALQRSYPNEVDIDTWAKNIADSVEKHFAGKRDLILVGHSMGGKVALYGVAHNIQNLGNLTDMVVTINAPVKDLNSFYVFGGGSLSDYFRGTSLISNQGVAESIAYYDSTADGLQVGTTKHWLACISAESAPTSPQFDILGVDPYPKDMDDGVVPISAQYAAGADAVYYGERGHGDFVDQPGVAGTIADQILRYLFGGAIETSVLTYSQTVEHHAGWFPSTYYWDDWLGEFPGPSGIISHINDLFFQWQEWEDVVDAYSPGYLPSSYEVQLDSLPLLTSVSQVRWLNPGDPTDFRLSIKSGAAPKGHIRARWNILQYQLLPPGINRDRYEIKLTGGTTLAGIPQAAWLTGNEADSRLRVWPQAEGPFRWLKAEVKVYRQQAVSRKLIDEVLPQTLTQLNQ